MMSEERICDRIKKVRQATGLTQKQFASRIEVQPSTIANYEIGRNDPSDAVLELICLEFHVNEKWLQTGKGEMFAGEITEPMEMLIKQYDLTERDRKFLEVFLLSSAENRASVMEFLNRLYETLR